MVISFSFLDSFRFLLGIPLQLFDGIRPAGQASDSAAGRLAPEGGLSNRKKALRFGGRDGNTSLEFLRGAFHGLLRGRFQIALKQHRHICAEWPVVISSLLDGETVDIFGDGDACNERRGIGSLFLSGGGRVSVHLLEYYSNNIK